MAPAWLAKLSGKGGGSIQVRANFPGAAVSLDGTQVGTTGGSPVVINDVAPGRHEVAVEKSGYTTTKQEFTLAAGQSLPLNLTLSPVSVEVPRPEARQGLRGRRRRRARRRRRPDPHPLPASGWRWSGTAVSAAFALKFGLNVRDINSQLDQYRRFPCSSDSSAGLCDVHNNPAPPLTTDQLSRSHSLTDQGNQDQLLQWVFVGLTGAFAIAGGVLLYKGFLASEGERRVRQITDSDFSLRRRHLPEESLRSSSSEAACEE